MKKGKSTQKSFGKKIGVDQVVDGFTGGYVRKIARSLIGTYGFTASDRQDIEQKIYLKLARFLPCDDPESPRWKAFVALISKQCIASMIRDQRALKRDLRRISSIHVVIGVRADGLVELAHTLGEEEIPSRRSTKRRSAQDLSDLKMDAASCIEKVKNVTLRELCHRIKQQSISQVAREMNVPRSTINSWLRNLRQQFEDAELKEYL